MRKSPSKTSDDLDLIKVISSGELSSHSNSLDEINFIKKGVLAKGLLTFSKLLKWDLESTAAVLGITSKELSSNKLQRLNSKATKNAIEITKLCQDGIEYFEGVENWNGWLDTPHLHFKGQPPRSVLNSTEGRKFIKRVINNLKYSFTA
ncbi:MULTISPECIES: MbcA/ParS/Xre antitoxin family protein [Pseudoalteromonas]|uniref:MbcA/ParS/Xre antitoxin family protein n=1 Tax=Pseudoalteromonas TaxID=53246 RepID=UPI0007B98AF7|nr:MULTISPECIES: MbcA/ParS/Xre antitoxin family protein [Pseudoalteromonas]KZY42699.1 hypothetical protein A3733_19440 [Pseudoalteromonas shioyasakiensis]MAE00997.1 DUF2384 domain-containing protein [Pseudoalteromonas sp.]MCF2917540.1 MbcA/ParS/Xre antitoxin family protein [Pseudoalteromonas sp. Cn5-37]